MMMQHKFCMICQIKKIELYREISEKKLKKVKTNFQYFFVYTGSNFYFHNSNNMTSPSDFVYLDTAIVRRNDIQYITIDIDDDNDYMAVLHVKVGDEIKAVQLLTSRVCEKIESYIAKIYSVLEKHNEINDLKKRIEALETALLFQTGSTVFQETEKKFEEKKRKLEVNEAKSLDDE